MWTESERIVGALSVIVTILSWLESDLYVIKEQYFQYLSYAQQFNRTFAVTKIRMTKIVIQLIYIRSKEEQIQVKQDNRHMDFVLYRTAAPGEMIIRSF